MAILGVVQRPAHQRNGPGAVMLAVAGGLVLRAARHGKNEPAQRRMAAYPVLCSAQLKGAVEAGRAAVVVAVPSASVPAAAGLAARSS